MSPDQLATEQAIEKRSGVASAIKARCTGCALGYTSIPPAAMPAPECYRCGEEIAVVTPEWPGKEWSLTA